MSLSMLGTQRTVKSPVDRVFDFEYWIFAPVNLAFIALSPVTGWPARDIGTAQHMLYRLVGFQSILTGDLPEGKTFR